MKSWIAAAIVCASVATAGAEMGPPQDLAANSRGAGKIVVARISDVQSSFATNRFGDQLIVSNAVLEVLETLKGAPEAVTSVTVEGGTVGDLTLRVSDLPQVKEGDRAVFFLDASGNGHVPHGRGHGILKLDDDDRVEGQNLTLAQVKDAVRGANAKGGR
jgi:threonine dehydrogenase-like Zn-dependent dehydrogenase